MNAELKNAYKQSKGGGVLVCGLVSGIRRIPNFPKSSHLIFVMSAKGDIGKLC